VTAGSWAAISLCGTWRYALGRQWAPGPVLGWIMLNPSKADAKVSDQTAVKCMTISRLAGYGGLQIGNLHAFRSPSPAVLREVARRDPERAAGPDCDRWLAVMLGQVDRVVLAWGAHGGEPWALPRRSGVLDLVGRSGIPVACLGATAAGEPRHPCRLANATPLQACSP
jgi:hypothetical protein